MIKRFSIYDAEKDKSDNSFHTLKAHSSIEILRDTLLLITPANSGSKALTMGQTTIHPGCRTTGHAHADREEVYFVIQGKGLMIVGEDRCEIGPGDAVYVPHGEFHATHNTGNTVLDYIWVTAAKIKEDAVSM